MAHTPDLPHFFEENINLEGLFDILSPKNNLVLADDMMLSDADGIILRVSENYERNFGFTHDSIVGKSAFDLEANGTFRPCITAEVIRQKKKITATQTINHTHKNVMTVGIPLFDQNGVLKYAVCFNTVSMEQINTIQQNYRHLQDSLQQYTQEIAELRLRATATDLVVKSPAMQRLWTLILNTANTKANILITGETGVGKSAVAKAIHAISNRANGPFIEVNCAVLHENLIESELFGYEKGAFTGAASGGKIGKIELANHGTLFLDEIGELSLALQAKLLRVLQYGDIQRVGDDRCLRVDVRVLAATNRDLREEVLAGRFRADLFHRLSVFPLSVPPLRERGDDVILLAGYFCEQCRLRQGLSRVVLSAGARNLLQHYSFPGNVRELEHAIHRAVVLARATRSGDEVILEAQHFAFPEVTLPPPEAAAVPVVKQNLREATEAFQRETIRQALAQNHHNWAACARLLETDVANLHRLAKRLGLKD